MQPLPFWLADGRSVWLLDRDKTAGAYLRKTDGSLQKLSGQYRVTELLGVAQAGTVYVAAPPSRRAATARCSRSLSPAPHRNLTPEPGWHDPTIAHNVARLVDVYSSLNDPPRAGLVETASGTARNLVPENATLKAALLPTKMLEVPTEYGPLDAT